MKTKNNTNPLQKARLALAGDSNDAEHDALYELLPVAEALLAACKLVIARWERGDLAEAANACHAAITKAEGSQP
jgi:hypothetical protein